MKYWALSFVLIAGSAAAVSNGEATPGYQSVFSDYRAYQEVPVAPWAESNNEMERLGGHAGHVAPQSAPAEAYPHTTVPVRPSPMQEAARQRAVADRPGWP